VSVGLFVVTALAGGAGAGVRYLLDLGLTRWLGSRFPWGTLVINITGSFALGVVAASIPDGAALTVVGTGLLGGYTTFSSVATASALLAVERRTVAAMMNTVVTLVLTVAAAALGLWLGGAF
jgi:CrcB protein